MIDWAQVLVIMLAVIVAVFIIAAIILLVLVIKLTYQIRMVAKTAEHTVRQLEHAVSGATRAMAPIALLKMITSRLFKR